MQPLVELLNLVTTYKTILTYNQALNIVPTTQKKQVEHKAVSRLLHRRQNQIRQGLQKCVEETKNMI